MAFFKQYIIQNTTVAKMFKPIKKLGKEIFGDTNEVIRSGNWYGNNTIWRTVIDLNKVMFYSNSDGSLRLDELSERKRYIGIVDGILGGEGNGPMAPDPVKSNLIVIGHDPVAIDAVCARVMGFDPLKIPSIKNSFQVKKYKITPLQYKDIIINYNNQEYPIENIPNNIITKFKPHFGWINHIEW